MTTRPMPFSMKWMNLARSLAVAAALMARGPRAFAAEPAAPSSPVPAAPATSPASAPAFPSRLSAKGRDIVDASGEVRAMRGVNLGSWLMMETWIPSMAVKWDQQLLEFAAAQKSQRGMEKALQSVGKFDDDSMKFAEYQEIVRKEFAKEAGEEAMLKLWSRLMNEPLIVDARTLDLILKRRFRESGAREVWTAFHDSWITETDLERAADMGFNFVRIPVWYVWFESDAKPGVYSDYGFGYLDRAIGWARAHHLYVMIDMHGAPGGQSPWDHTGDLSRAELFESKPMLKRTTDLWAAIAKRYKDESAVFAYDALNEPFSAKDAKDWARVHGAIYNAIRGADPDHIIVMEDGYKLEDEPYKTKGFFPKPSERGWKQVIYSAHFYEEGSGLDKWRERLAEVARVGEMEQERTGVPFYIGEFSPIANAPNALEGFALCVDEFNRRGWAWSPWTFKYTGENPRKTLWGVYQYKGKWDWPDPNEDTKEEVIAKIKKLRSENFEPVQNYAKVLRKALAAPAASAEKAEKAEKAEQEDAANKNEPKTAEPSKGKGKKAAKTAGKKGGD